MSKFVIKKAKSGVMFNFVSSNGEIVATSEVYTTKTSCKNGIASVQKNAGSEVENLAEKNAKQVKGAKYELYKDKRGEFRFRLKAGNAQIIATGQGYKTKDSCMNGIKSIKTGAPKAQIVDETLAEVAKKVAPAKKAPPKKAAAQKKPAKKAAKK